MKRAVVSKWVGVVFGADLHQHLRVQQALLAAGLYAALSAVAGVGAWLGLVAPHPAAWFAVVVLGVSALVYGLIRSGASAHVRADPGLTGFQSLFFVAASTWAYVIAGPVRGAMLMAVLTGQVFGLFALKPARARWLGGLVVAVLGLAMGWCAVTDPAHFAPAEELLHFLLLALLMPLLAWLAGPLAAMRSSVRQHQLSLERATQQHRLLTTQDELTGLSNRRHMTALMVAERARQQRSGTPISMVLMDIDHFKRINDRCGNHGGDQVLQIFADVITHGLRAGDALARWGGEEFLLMLPHTSAEDALVCVERMRSQLAERSFQHIGPGLAVTFSAGIGVCTMDDRVETAIERADAAMHRAKGDGRNRTVVA